MPSAEQEGPDAATERARTALGRHLLAHSEASPGWDRLVAEFVPDFGAPGSSGEPGAYFVRTTEVRDGVERPGPVRRLGPQEDLARLLEDFRAEYHAPGRGTWWDGAVILRAAGWPRPSFHVGLDLNTRDEPLVLDPGGVLDEVSRAAELERFPRNPENERQQAAPGVAETTARSQENTMNHPETDPNPASEEVQPDVNIGLDRALEHFREAPTEQTIAAVLSSLLAGEVLLDISDSELVPGPQGEPIGPGSSVRVQTMRVPSGARALVVYSGADVAEEVYAATDREGQQLLHLEPALRVLQNFLGDPSCTEIMVDPGTDHECRIDGRQIEWVMGAPRNDAAKAALVAGNMQQLLGSFMSPQAMLLMGISGQEAGASPVFVPAEDGSEPDTILLFTSAAEVAALDTSLKVRSLPALSALSFAMECGAEDVQINALGAVGKLPGDQVRELLDLADSQGLLDQAAAASPA